MKVDASDVFRLAVELKRVEGELPKGASKAVEVAAYNVKDVWRKDLERSAVPAAGSTIVYKLAGNGSSPSAVIASTRGSDRLRGFAYANEYGSRTVTPRRSAQVALDRTAADLARGAEIAGERALRRAMGLGST